MKKHETFDSSPTPMYDSAKVIELMSDPIRLAIVLELMRNPGATSIEIKSKINLPGSRIYYYLNQLADQQIIEEADTEKLSRHMSRRKFRISEWFIKIFEELDREFHEGEYRRASHLFQIHYAIMVLNQQARLLEKISEVKFKELMKTLNLPHQQLFFVTKDTLPIINKSHQEVMTQIYQKSMGLTGMVDLIKDSSHVAIFGAYPLD